MILIFLFTHKATNPRFVVLQNNHYFCIGNISFLRLDGFNMEWNMIFIVWKHVIHVSTLFYFLPDFILFFYLFSNNLLSSNIFFTSCLISLIAVEFTLGSTLRTYSASLISFTLSKYSDSA